MKNTGRFGHFPMFITCERHVFLVVGGGKVALRRVHTLLNFDMHIRLVSPDASDELAALSDSGLIEWRKRSFEQNDIDDISFAAVCTDDREVNQLIGKLCRERQIPVSVADAPEECTFFFPAVAFGENVVAGIGGNGKDHGAVVAAAKKVRKVLEPSAGKGRGGSVCLVGAGPGDPELMTVKGMKRLSQADVVVYDRLVGPEIIEMIPDSAEKIDVGKTSGNHPVPQHEISRILLNKALEGKFVVRLKGGDSFVFGRGGEELELLCDHNIPFEVVPGITSAIAGPASAGIPVTHRDHCASFHVVAGHRRENGTLDIDYEALVRAGGTIVFLMSVKNAPEIAAGLIKGGMPETMPCAMIENATLPSQRKVISTLGYIGEDMRNAEIQPPALFVVGTVCALSNKFSD